MKSFGVQEGEEQNFNEKERKKSRDLQNPQTNRITSSQHRQKLVPSFNPQEHNTQEKGIVIQI